MGVSLEGQTPDNRKMYNQAAREEMKLRLLADIRADLMVCELEGWDKREYIRDIRDLLNSFNV